MTYLRVRELAENQGLNIQNLSHKSQLAYTTVHGIWHDRVHQLNRRTLDRIAIALGVRVADLFGGDPEGEHVASISYGERISLEERQNSG